MTAAARADAKTVALDGFGHRWMLLCRLYGVDVPAMSLQLHEWDIHIVCRGTDDASWLYEVYATGVAAPEVGTAAAPDMMQMTDYDADEFYLRS